jgi:hypothetical protein
MNNPVSRNRNLFRRHLFSAAIGVLCLAPAGVMAADSEIPANLDNGLREVMAEAQPGRSAAANAKAPDQQQRGVGRLAVRDSQGRVMVTIHLNGTAPMAQVRNQLASVGAKITAENNSYRNGVISAYVPVNKLAELARSPGVLSLSLGRRPIRNAGAAISGGALELRTDVLNGQGLNGSGITVGVLSDSYDQATTDSNGDPLAIHAAQDVLSGDLPGIGNPEGDIDPVVVLEDSNDPAVGDEGRAMLQIVHDIAPKAKLAFATAFVSIADFAANIRKLRTDANCDVIVDDVFYTEEPFFSDGMIAQAVDDVATSSVLAGKKCAYFSSAGNQQGGGYFTTFEMVSDASARLGLPGQNLNLTTVPAALTSGGFHNFNPDPSAPPDISQRFIIPAQGTFEFDCQWNDPFDLANGVTTDYNILIFDGDGNFLSAVSGTADNFATQEPIEDISVANTTDNDATYQIVISRADSVQSTNVATKIRYVAIDDFGSGVGGEEYYQPAAPAIFGHSCSVHALGVAAYVYDETPSNPVAPPFTPVIEDFTSQGPATIDFDAAGNRLAQSEVRQKPEIAGPDGGNTTFFGDDYEGDGFPNFFGTSAAAPHAAGVAALLLQKAGGPGSLTEQQIRTALENSVLKPHDVDPFFSKATLTPRSKKRKHGSGTSVTVTAFGNGTNASSRDPNFFTVTFSPGKVGESLTRLTIDLSEAGLKFDSTTDIGFPFTLGQLQGISASSISTNIRTEDDNIASITLFFAKNSFTAGTSVSFGIDRDFIGDGAGNGADLLQGAELSAQTKKNGMSGTFVNAFGKGATIVDGFGLIDALNAAQAIP